MARNELRVKYHYHTCLIRLPSNLFDRFYEILYSRILGFNRYTIILGRRISEEGRLALLDFS